MALRKFVHDLGVGYIGYELSRSRVATNMCTYGHAVTHRVALNLYPFALLDSEQALAPVRLADTFAEGAWDKLTKTKGTFNTTFLTQKKSHLK